MQKVCFVGLDNLPVLSRQHNRHGIGGDQVPTTSLALGRVRRGGAVATLQRREALHVFASLQGGAALRQQARAVAPRLLDEHPTAAVAQVQRWLASRVEFLKA